MSLSELKAAVPVRERKVLSVDIGGYLEPVVPAGQKVLVFHELDVHQVYQALGDLDQVLKMYPLWHADTRFNFLLFTLAHREPKSENADELIEFYAHIADNNQPLWFEIVKKFTAAYPWVYDLFKAADEKKDA